MDEQERHNLEGGHRPDRMRHPRRPCRLREHLRPSSRPVFPVPARAGIPGPRRQNPGDPRSPGVGFQHPRLGATSSMPTIPVALPMTTRGWMNWKPCPECGRSAYIRADGSLGRHTYHINRKMYVCPVGDDRDHTPQPWGRRITVRIDVVVPKEWTNNEFRMRAAQALRDHLNLHSTFLVNLDVDRDE